MVQAATAVLEARGFKALAVGDFNNKLPRTRRDQQVLTLRYWDVPSLAGGVMEEPDSTPKKNRITSFISLREYQISQK
ncbi:hypothetical protein [Streptomyces parvulus]|uniref:hypothetical protein n=1 Tax=Streptomyces parvulus TaxID=146923 RepID=UPI001CFB2641|nr:hypothetical protein [Streptomyces parvulus]MCQ4195745.1 hypothetical protein [Streptomyces parvulus]